MKVVMTLPILIFGEPELAELVRSQRLCGALLGRGRPLHRHCPGPPLPGDRQRGRSSPATPGSPAPGSTEYAPGPAFRPADDLDWNHGFLLTPPPAGKLQRRSP